LSDKVIKLIPGSDSGILADEAVLPTAYDTSVMKFSVQVTPYIESLKLLLRGTDSSLLAFHELVRPGLFSKITRELLLAENALEGYVEKSEGWKLKTWQITSTINNTSKSAADMASNNASRTNSLQSMQYKTETIKRKQLKADIESLKTSFASLSKSLAEINHNDSAGIGKMLSNKQSYQSSTANFDTMNRSLRQSYKSPSGFSIFGKSKKK
jgi:hypothetical protein